MSDAKKLHRFLRSLLVAGASLLIIASAAFAGNALAPASPATVVSQVAAEDDPGDVDDSDLDAPRVETPGADDADETEVDAAKGFPTAEEVAENSQAQEEDDQGPTDDADDANDVNDDQDEDQDDADEADDDDADEAGDDEADDDADDADDGDEDGDDDSDDSGEDDD